MRESCLVRGWKQGLLIIAILVSLLAPLQIPCARAALSDQTFLYHSLERMQLGQSEGYLLNGDWQLERKVQPGQVEYNASLRDAAVASPRLPQSIFVALKEPLPMISIARDPESRRLIASTPPLPLVQTINTALETLPSERRQGAWSVEINLNGHAKMAVDFEAKPVDLPGDRPALLLAFKSRGAASGLQEVAGLSFQGAFLTDRDYTHVIWGVYSFACEAPAAGGADMAPFRYLNMLALTDGTGQNQIDPLQVPELDNWMLAAGLKGAFFPGELDLTFASSTAQMPAEAIALCRSAIVSCSLEVERNTNPLPIIAAVVVGGWVIANTVDGIASVITDIGRDGKLDGNGISFMDKYVYNVSGEGYYRLYDELAVDLGYKKEHASEQEIKENGEKIGKVMHFTNSMALLYKSLLEQSLSSAHVWGRMSGTDQVTKKILYAVGRGLFELNKIKDITEAIDIFKLPLDIIELLKKLGLLQEPSTQPSGTAAPPAAHLPDPGVTWQDVDGGPFKYRAPKH